jgi:hypothetical protein
MNNILNSIEFDNNIYDVDIKQFIRDYKLENILNDEKGLKRKKMQSNVKHQQFNTMPKLAGLIASGWLAINCGSLSYDRTPEIRRVRETVV